MLYIYQHITEPLFAAFKLKPCGNKTFMSPFPGFLQPDSVQKAAENINSMTMMTRHWPLTTKFVQTLFYIWRDDQDGSPQKFTAKSPSEDGNCWFLLFTLSKRVLEENEKSKSIKKDRPGALLAHGMASHVRQGRWWNSSTMRFYFSLELHHSKIKDCHVGTRPENQIWFHLWLTYSMTWIKRHQLLS